MTEPNESAVQEFRAFRKSMVDSAPYREKPDRYYKCATCGWWTDRGGADIHHDPEVVHGSLPDNN